MRKSFLLLFIIFTLLITQPAAAQASGPIYIVQSGDTLWSIAARFNVTIDELMAANSLVDANLQVGQQLIIPGLEGLTGFLNTEVVGFGDSLRGLARRNQVPVSLLQKLNHIISPSELYVGVSLIVPQQDGVTKLAASATPATGETLLELAVRQNSDPWTLSALNNLGGTWDALPGDSLYSPSGAGGSQTASGLPPAFLSAEVKSLPLKQGGTAQIIVRASEGATLGGFLVDRSLHFFEMGDGRQAALQGVHALLEPGVYPLHLDAALSDGSIQSYEQMVLVASGNYPLTSLTVDPATLDPTVTEPENQKILGVVTPVTSQKYWQAPFILPVDAQYCIKDWFGGRRSYNSGLYNGFHSGVDYGICSETKPYDIYAPAPGVVVLSEKLFVRGNATIIDHGQGIYSGYWHQEETYVSVGDVVTAGQLIGKIGGTGRVTGPHLHWEIWVNGIQVDPLDWLDTLIP